jgi:hypothetical protein
MASMACVDGTGIGRAKGRPIARTIGNLAALKAIGRVYLWLLPPFTDFALLNMGQQKP